MKPMNSANLVCLSFLFGINSVAVAQQSDADSLFSLSFEQLMQVEVSLAAKKSETWLNSSGTVYVVSRDEISNYGWRDLKEILASIPNMDYFYQWSWLPGGQRGFTGNMSGTLMLIDGREVQNLLANEAFIMNNFPASRIERVEILQGPNSTLYGGNATQGVINVITRLGSDGNEISLLAGEASTRHGNLLLNHQQGDLSLAMNVSYFQSAQDYRELQEFVFDTQAFSRSPKDGLRDLSEQRFRNDETNYTIDAKVQYQRSYAGVNISRSENVSGIEAVAYDYITGDDSRRGYALYYLGQTFAPNEKLSGTVELSYFREYKEKDRLTAIIPEAAQSYQDITLYNEREDIGPSDRLRLSTQWQYRLNDNSDWIVGYDGWKTEIGRKIKYRDSATGITLFTPAEWAQDKEKSEKHALYGQYSKTFKWQQESLKVSAGLRYNQQDFTDSAYLPRASLVYQPDPDQAFKLTYGEAFRPPTIFEFDLVVDDELPSQTMKMTELNWSKAFTVFGIDFANIAAIYHMEAENFYEKILDPRGNLWRTQVAGSHTVKGFEDQLKFTAGNWQGQLALRYASPDKETINGRTEVLNIPKLKIKLGLVYQLSEQWRIAGFVDHWSDTFTEANLINSPGTEITKIDAWTTLNLHLVRQTEQLSYGLYLENVFNQRFYHANARGTSPLQYLQAPRNLRLQFSYRF